MISRVGISLLFFGLASCGQSNEDTTALRAQVDRLQRQVDSAYVPGLGEFMSGIQVHHAKLWFAGKAENWPLANFEIGEIRETGEDIEKYCNARPEVASFPMLIPALDSVDRAIQNKNGPAFQHAFILLTSTCNNCHKATNHAFNVIRIPDSPPFTNQFYTKQP